MINSVTITGHLGQDPESVVLEGGLLVSNFSVAINEVFGKGENRRETTHWISCKSYGNMAHVVSNYLNKGSKVTVNGKLHQSSWVTSEGEKRSRLGVVVGNIDFMSKKLEDSEDTATEESAENIVEE
ncbi:single-stranded DNA-binding protein [bacterium]|nr:single-stranded DNA-binding protein [bacterium]